MQNTTFSPCAKMFLGRSVRVAGLSLFLAATGARAEQSLSLREALEMADRRSPAMLLAERSVREAAAKKVGAGVVTSGHPKLSIEARPPITQGTLGDIGYGGMFDMMFEVGGAPSARVREAGAGVAVAEGEKEGARVEARRDVYEAYVEGVIAESRVEQKRSALEIAEKVLDASRKREASGASGEIDVSASLVEKNQGSVAVLSAQADRERSIGRLRLLLDLEPAETGLQLTSKLGAPPALPDVKVLLASAFEKRPELKIVAARLRQATATESRLRRENAPKLGFYLGVDAAPVSPIFGMVGATIEWPLFQRNQAALAGVSEQKQTEDLRAVVLRRSIETEVRTAMELFRNRTDQLRLLSVEVVPAARRTLELVEAGWTAGRFDIFRLTTAAREYSRARELELDALRSVWIDRLRVMHLVGDITE
ncbi:MAG: TolC family protein [Polyangiaceae bacterium]|nr:TolC family protein [Polyangiaceae bacterium]